MGGLSIVYVLFLLSFFIAVAPGWTATGRRQGLLVLPHRGIFLLLLWTWFFLTTLSSQH